MRARQPRLAATLLAVSVSLASVFARAQDTPAPTTPAPAPPETPPNQAPAAGPSEPAPAPGAPAEPAPETPAPAVPEPPPGAELPKPAPATPVAKPAEPAAAAPTPVTQDRLSNAGYLPGYRTYPTLGLSPYVPRVGSLPGGLTAQDGSRLPAGDWTFRFSGFMSATLQTSLNTRTSTTDDQHSLVFHVPPQTVDEYASFMGTNTMPGQWVALNFAFGKPAVTANISLNTWNPTEPTTYYQLGSQYFISNAFLAFTVPPMGSLRIGALAGYFYRNYGNLSQYGLGMYTNSIVGGPRGVGELVTAEYDIDSNWTLLAEHGFMGTRNGAVGSPVIVVGNGYQAPNNQVRSSANGSVDPVLPAAWIHHMHLGITKKGEPTFRAQVHYLTNWAQDDRGQRPNLAVSPSDDMTTRQIDEGHIRDGRIDVYAFDAALSSGTWGYLAGAIGHIKARNAFPLRGLITFGGEGQTLTDRWFGGITGGTGSVTAAALNYGASIGHIVSYPAPFSTGPDLTLNAGVVVATSNTDLKAFDNRLRHKYGVDLLYTFLPFLGAGVRVDRVVPNSKDSRESFEVLAPRLVFKTDWNSRDTITLLYAKWFYGKDTHPDGSTNVGPVRIDDQLLALSISMWW